MSSASSANLPRIMSASGRTLRALMRAKRCVALNDMSTTSLAARCTAAGGTGGRFSLLGFAAVAFERSRGSEFAEPVADHVFGDKHLQVRLAVVDHEGQPNKLGHDRAR